MNRMLQMTKPQIRSLLKEQRNQLSPHERINLDGLLRERLFQSKAYQDCMNLFIFVSFQSEVDTHEIIRQALAQGKRVYVPRVETNTMDFYKITSLEGLIPSNYGVLEPIKLEANRYKEESLMDSNSISHNLMLLPGLAFDKKGNRIGYGAGFYDKYFATHLKIAFYKIALGYDFQIFEGIPADEYDIKVDTIITPSQTINIHTN